MPRWSSLWQSVLQEYSVKAWLKKKCICSEKLHNRCLEGLEYVSNDYFLSLNLPLSGDANRWFLHKNFEKAELHLYKQYHRLKFAKTQANAKQHTEDELLLFENYSLSSPTFSSKDDRTYSQKYAHECLFSCDYMKIYNEN